MLQFVQAKLTKGLVYVLTARATVHLHTFANVAEDRTPHKWIDWHKRFGHIVYSGLQQLYNEKLADGMVVNEHSPMLDCEACMQAKQTQAPFPPG
jgi:hypothetical protein